ncbi:nucleotidyltransferase family protein [Candidatus Poribacteria bacterium]|nr:nucleotidyltransferase family protein [Candidatus Poribacteria bacterium]
MPTADTKHVAGIILAAGASTRMGSLKQLLPFGDVTVLEACIGNFRDAGTAPIVVVLGFAAERIRSELADALSHPDVIVAVNDRHETGMLSSVQCAVLALQGAAVDGIVVGLVDQPFVQAATIRSVRHELASGTATVVVPVYEGRRGHPIGLSMALRDEILRLDSARASLRDVVAAHEGNTAVVAISDDSIRRDMDTPEDYRRELERLQHPSGRSPA